MKKLILALVLGLCLASCKTSAVLPENETDQVSTETEQWSETAEAVALSDLEKHGIEVLENGYRLEDGLGQQVVVPKQPTRVVCGYNSYVDLWYKLGGELVGKIKPSADLPVPAADGVEIIGDNKGLNEESILALKPDLVILGMQNNQLPAAENLKQTGIPVLVMDAKNLAEYVRVVRIFSAILGSESAYQTHGVAVAEQVQAIIDQVPSDIQPRILLMNNTSKAVNVSASKNMTGEMLRDLGAVNIADGTVEGEQGRNFSLEQILVEDPDFIFIRPMGSDSEAVAKVRKEQLEESPVWSSLSAVTKGHYYVLDKELYTFKPNERYAEAYLNLAKILYPEQFE